jgi:predicted  nucleic acid-binding Zn-ribbon protein
MDSKEQEEILYRIDERTEQIRDEIKRVEDRQKKQKKKIDDLESQTQKNTSDIKVGKALLGAIGTAVTAVLAKVGGIFA